MNANRSAALIVIGVLTLLVIAFLISIAEPMTRSERFLFLFCVICAGVYALAMVTMGGEILRQEEPSWALLIIYITTTVSILSASIALGRRLNQKVIIPSAIDGRLPRLLSESWLFSAIVAVGVVAGYMGMYVPVSKRTHLEHFAHRILLRLIPFVVAGPIWGFLIWLH